MRKAARLGAALLVMGLSGAAGAAEAPLTLEAINQAQFGAGAPDKDQEKKAGKKETAKAAEKGADPLTVRVQVLLDRAGFSPAPSTGATATICVARSPASPRPRASPLPGGSTRPCGRPCPAPARIRR